MGNSFRLDYSNCHFFNCYLFGEEFISTQYSFNVAYPGEVLISFLPMLPIRINYDENGDPALTVEKECSIRFFDVFENEYEQRIFYYWDNDNAMVSISPAKLIKGH